MLRCCTSDEVLFFMSAALTNGEHKIIKHIPVGLAIHYVSYLPPNHPVAHYSVWLLILALACTLHVWTQLNKQEVNVVAILCVLDAQSTYQ